jgi:hypothetical protein
MFLPVQLICHSKLGAKLSFYYMWREGGPYLFNAQAGHYYSQSREYYRVLIEPPLLTISTVQPWTMATLERMRPPFPPPNVAGRREKGGGSVKCWQTNMIYYTPMLEPGRKRPPSSLLCDTI